MNRKLVVGIAIFFAVMGIALFGIDTQAMAGGGCVGCGVVVDSGYIGPAVTSCCAPVVDCCMPRPYWGWRRAVAMSCCPPVSCCPRPFSCCGTPRYWGHRAGCCPSEIDCCGSVVVGSPVQNGGVFQKGGVIQKSEPLQKAAPPAVPTPAQPAVPPEPAPAKAASLDHAPTVFFQVSFRR